MEEKEEDLVGEVEEVGEGGKVSREVITQIWFPFPTTRWQQNLIPGKV